MIRLVCKTHNHPLENMGNGRFLYPTSSREPNINEGGWMEIDFSEFLCPVDNCDGSSWELEVKN